ncbi:CinA family protein [Leucobacter sp. UCMA 4100]|uniref:CinA family protein n=1 Tax=Leucobacter sp. UCMA 4100 TaxID=2810534 RepID=UPI0022EA32F1|nr:nicotinamide-nucleotide amidohydrolase family protein [Leucobacter sp. UCMA 4100]MDA3147896.1 CinA family protein [Leucobacter sp. UCMA 4100]
MSQETGLAATVLEWCAGRSLTLATAESLTGGMLAAELVAVPGASRVFSGGVIAYDTALKHSVLRVNERLLAEHGPVHRDVALAMAEGVRHACAVRGVPASLGLATTGVAGPDPDAQTGQAAGTVWIAWAAEGRAGAEQLMLTGSRSEIREETVQAALRLLLLNLSDDGSDSGFSRE